MDTPNGIFPYHYESENILSGSDNKLFLFLSSLAGQIKIQL
jgi:hypothetical protein